MFSALGGAPGPCFGIVKSYSVLSDNKYRGIGKRCDTLGLIGYVSAKRNCRYNGKRMHSTLLLHLASGLMLCFPESCVSNIR